MVVGSPNGFATAWHNTGLFWVETLRAVGRHPLVVLGCAVVPAAERAYLLLETKPIPRWRLTLLEAILTLWRILLCVGLVWVAVAPDRWRLLQLSFSGNAEAQLALQRIGANLGNHLHAVLWELAIFAVTFLLLNYLLVVASRGLARRGALREARHRKAFVSVLRNLVLAPLALIYLVELLQLRVY